MVRPGFEPGAFCVLDRCDNQLRHRTSFLVFVFGLHELGVFFGQNTIETGLFGEFAGLHRQREQQRSFPLFRRWRPEDEEGQPIGRRSEVPLADFGLGNFTLPGLLLVNFPTSTTPNYVYQLWILLFHHVQTSSRCLCIYMSSVIGSYRLLDLIMCRRQPNEPNDLTLSSFFSPL
jgi:hypothetical protein